MATRRRRPVRPTVRSYQDVTPPEDVTRVFTIEYVVRGNMDVVREDLEPALDCLRTSGAADVTEVRVVSGTLDQNHEILDSRKVDYFDGSPTNLD